MKLRVHSVDFHITECTTRLPFRYGMVTLVRAPLCTARARIETEDGETALGYSADLLAPKWFEKDPEKSLTTDFLNLSASARAAAGVLCDPAAGEATVFDHWWRTYRVRVHERPPDAADRLVRGFGVALVERALIDAACRAAGRGFHAALASDLFGFRPGAVLDELEGWDLAAGLPSAPLDRVRLRHTVGMLDPLSAADIAPDERLDDGLPQALGEDIEAYGLDIFKLKLSGDQGSDLQRLLAIGEVLETSVPGSASFTLDGNEQFEDLSQLVGLFRALEAVPAGRRLLDGLLFIEQPLARAVSFDYARTAAMPELREWAPVIIDESDSGVDSFPRALELGYTGISVKNCKGVFRTLLNRGLCAVRGGGLFQSPEDLTNLPVLALQQDLATVAALGLSHVERNGHHYFRGLDHLPAAERRVALEHHPGLYRESEGEVFLRIENGALDLRSLHGPGYGHDVPPDLDARTPLDEWEKVQRP